MPRVKTGPYRHRHHKKILKLNAGQFGTRHRLYRRANEAMLKSLWYSYRDRRQRKRDLRHLWIARINAAARIHGTTYSKLISSLEKKQVGINRKVLADLAANHQAAFAEIVKFATA